MEYDRITLGRLAKEQGFVRDTLEKVCRLTDILLFMQRDGLLNGRLALKGGTAINLTVFDLPRLSVDIDLDYVGSAGREQMLEDRARIRGQIGKYMAAAGYTASQKSKQYHALDSFVYEYQNAGGMKDNLKIEINYMLRCHIFPMDQRKIGIPWLAPGTEIMTVHPIEIYGSKMTALINRNAPRDLYDCYRMIQASLIPKSEMDLLRKCVVFYGAIGSATAPLDFSADEIAKTSPMRIRTDLFPVLQRGEKFDAGTAETTVRNYLRALLNLTDEEKQFLLCFSQKQYRPELLFDDADVLARIAHHPMAVWKCEARDAQPPIKE